MATRDSRLLPLTVKSVRSTYAMQELQPKIKELQKRYGKDRQRISQETMRLYQEHGVNPAAGCLPMLMQIPIFFGLYFAIQSLSKSGVGVFASATGGLVPSIDTREIVTQVLVNDGQTVVLGGILETERRETEKKVPYLGDVPVLGRLFKTTGRTNNKDELLIFVTPKILREGVSVY